MQIVVILMFTKIELKQYYFDAAGYFSSLWNCNDAAFLVINIIQVVIKSCRFNRRIVPHDWRYVGDHDVDKFLIVISVLLILSTSIKILALLRQYKEIGNLVAILLACFSDVSGFLVFMMLFIFMISSLYKLIGADFIFMEKDYVETHEFFIYVI